MELKQTFDEIGSVGSVLKIRRDQRSYLVRRGFSANQHLYLYYEVYDPAKQSSQNEPEATKHSKPGVHVLSNVAFFQGSVKAYETQLVSVQDITAPNRKAAIFQLDVPLSQLKPGFYTCQVNVIDDAAGHFAFPRLAMLVRR